MSHPSLRSAILSSGANVDGASAVPLHFGAPRAELRAVLELCAVADRSSYGRLLGAGPDLADLLHRLSTADVKAIAKGEGKPTVLTTGKGRIVERVFVHHLGEAGLLLSGGPGSAVRVREHLDRYTFREQTGLEDRTETICQLALVGPLAAQALETAGFERPAPFGTVIGSLDGHPVWVLGQDGLTGAGFSLCVETEHGPSLWQTLVLAVGRLDGRPAGEQALEAGRVLNGVPAPGHELTGDYNPLEAGQWDAVSFSKGCYVGQEVVARLNTYDKVSRDLVGLEFAKGQTAARPGDALVLDGREVGRVTSVVHPEGFEGPIGLAYLKRKAGGAGDEVRWGDDRAVTVVELPFPRPEVG